MVGRWRGIQSEEESQKGGGKQCEEFDSCNCQRLCIINVPSHPTVSLRIAVCHAMPHVHARVCVSATLVCCYHTCPVSKPPVNTFISWGDQSVKKCSDCCSDHMGCAHTVPQTPLTERMRLGFVSLHQQHRLKK